MRKHFCFLFSSCFINALDKTFKDDVGGTANMERRLKMNAVLIAVSIVLSNYADFTQSCLWSERSLEDVSVCPDTEQGTQKAERIKKCEGLSVRQNCTINKLKFKYHCLYSYPSHELVEVCATEISVHGGCVVYDTKQSEIRHISTVKCGDSCPDVYMSSRAHLVAPCPSLENWTKNNPRDPDNITVSYTTEDRAIPTDTITLMNVPNVTDTSTTVITPVEQESVDIGVIIGIVLAILFVLCIVLAVVFWRRRRRYSPVPESDKELDELHLNLGQYELREYAVWKTSISELGEYAVWKTSISDQFSSLSDDEVCVLFSFLCSDSGTPDFTDTYCLDILNEIRGAHFKESATSEEAQRTLDGLKSRDFLWDQDGVHLSEDVEDETMHRVIGRATVHATVPHRTLHAVYRLSSYTTAVRYLRSQGYTRKSGEKCVISDGLVCDSLLIHRLQMNILTHATMEDTRIFDKVSQSLNIPLSRVHENDERRAFLEELNQNGKCVQYRGASQGSVQHVNWLWGERFAERPEIVKSCIGLQHPHRDIYIINNTAYRKHSPYHDRPPAERCLLYCLMMVDDYTVNVKDESHIKVYNAIREQYFTDLPVCEEIPALQNPEGIVHVENDVIKFKSDDMRHDVMYAFVTECLVKDSDLKFFLTTGSRDVISEYCRSWDYERTKEERCLYIPYEMHDLFIDRLQLDILTHCTVSDREIHDSISKRLHIPKEVISWSDDAKRRFLASFQKGSIEMFRARGMIVGCAGAGKTTILRRLQRHQTEYLKKETETTVGLEVYNEMFEIISDKLEDFKSGNDDNRTSLHENKKLISMTDFAGQVAYYACHQIYLSRRAFYLLVIDMSKQLKAKAYSPKRYNPTGSLFENWTYEQYFVFWLQSIKTYCDDKKKREKYGEGATANPVIIIASHRDKSKVKQVRNQFYKELEECLPKEQTLKSHISPERYFEVECPKGNLSENQKHCIDSVRKCIVNTATSLPHWGEKIPTQWSYFEEIVNKQKNKKVLNRADLWGNDCIQFANEDDMDDMLRFYQEIGQIIYFSDEGLRDVIILDVQWFVDAFKIIITDPTHVEGLCVRRKDWEAFMKSGLLSEATLDKIWEEKNKSYVKHKETIMPYMEKLGLLAKVKYQKDEKHAASGEIAYYIPSINKKDLENEDKEMIDAGNKTPVLLFYFRCFLPHFFFYRLIVNCLQKWKSLQDGLFFKNAAFYKEKGGSHYIALAVSKTSIQLQVFTPEKNVKLDEETTKRIRLVVEDMIKEITTTFHEQVECEKGFPCKDLGITEEDEDLFLREDEVYDLDTSYRTCPKHLKKHERHQIDRDNLLKYWHRTPNPNAPNTAQ